MSFFEDQQGGGPAAASLKLAQIGASFFGVVEHISTGWKSKYNANPNAQRENELGPDGQPIPELRVVVAGQPDNYATATKPLVNEQGQALPDDGRRTVYIAKGTNISFATAAALKEISPQGGPLKDLEVGGKFGVMYEKDIPTQNGNPARGHVVRYQAPAPNSGGFFGGQAQQAPAQNVTQTPQFQQAAQQQGFQQPPVQNPPQQGWQQPQTQPQPNGWPTQGAQQPAAPQQGFQGQPGPQMLAGQPNPMADPNAPGQQFQQPTAPAADPWAGQTQGQPPAGQQNWAPGQVSDQPPF